MTDPFASSGAKAPAKPFTITDGQRKVRSFVLRQGRFTEAQQRAFDELWPRFGLDYAGTPRDFDAALRRGAAAQGREGEADGAFHRKARS